MQITQVQDIFGVCAWPYTRQTRGRSELRLARVRKRKATRRNASARSTGRLNPGLARRLESRDSTLHRLLSYRAHTNTAHRRRTALARSCARAHAHTLQIASYTCCCVWGGWDTGSEKRRGRSVRQTGAQDPLHPRPTLSLPLCLSLYWARGAWMCALRRIGTIMTR